MFREDLPPPKTTDPSELRSFALEQHANTIHEMVREAANQGIFPGELGAFVLAQFLEFNGLNYSNEAPTPIQSVLIDYSGPGQANRPPVEAIKAARDGSGAKKFTRYIINSAFNPGASPPLVQEGDRSGPPPRRDTDGNIPLDLTYLS